MLRPSAQQRSASRRPFGPDGETLIAAAFLHDIGYAPELAMTGFHPLDGARFVRAHGEERIARIVAHHSGARLEAELRGIDGYCDEFPFEDGPRRVPCGGGV